jgi:hypothetical protein
MALQNKSWLKNEVLREYLSGEPQESIANKLNISVGTVNSIVSEFIKSDDTIDLQRQIAIVAKKNGVDIPQIAANLRFKNKVKQSSLDDRKIEKLFDGLEMLFNKFNISPSVADKMLFSIIELMLRDNIDPLRLEEVIKTKSVEMEMKLKDLEETKSRVKQKQDQLRIKDKDLDHFSTIRTFLELDAYPEFSEDYGVIARAIINFKELGYNPKVIVTAFGKSEGLMKKTQRLKARLKELEKLLESYRKKQNEEEARWKDYYPGVEKLNRLIKAGLDSESIFRAVNVLENDLENNDIDQLIEDIRTYGSISAARRRLGRLYETETAST